MPRLLQHLAESGFRVEELTRSDARARFEAWCEAFLAAVKAASGSYRYRGLHWHAFSYGVVSADSGNAAMQAYSGLDAESVAIIPEDWSRGCGVLAVGETLPDLSGLGMDLYVFPESLAWTMVFTHDRVHGPYVLTGPTS